MSTLITSRLKLQAFAVADYEAALLGDAALAARLGGPVAPGWLEHANALRYWLDRVRTDEGLLRWALYGYFDRATGEMLGGGGFKGRPSDADGSVELGYGLAPSARGRGLATEAAVALAAWAWTQPGVARVTANTLPTENASTAVLRRAGFVRAGETTDPDEGLVWCWEHQRG